MDSPSDERPDRRAALATILRSLRRHRGLRAAEVAEAMRLPLRSYEYFEAGGGRLNLDRIHQFAEAIDVDPFAILAALDIGSPAFAVRCADHKFMMLLTMALQEFDEAVGEDFARLEARTLIAACTQFFDTLATEVRQHTEFVARWMADKPLNGRPLPDASPGGEADLPEPDPS